MSKYTLESLKLTLDETRKRNNVQFSDKADKIINAKIRLDCGLKCPCDINNPERGCISTMCLKDINEKGTCHCGLFRK